MIGMTKTMSKEWGRLKVCVNCVAFGFIDTRLTKANDDPATRIAIDGQEIQAGLPAQVRTMFETMVPLGRAGTVEEAAGSIYLLCSPESDYVSGQLLRSDEPTSELQSLMRISTAVFCLKKKNPRMTT